MMPPVDGAWPLAEPFAIGGVTIPNRVVQAPLAGIANWAFRLQSRRHGAGMAVSGGRTDALSRAGDGAMKGSLGDEGASSAAPSWRCLSTTAAPPASTTNSNSFPGRIRMAADATANDPPQAHRSGRLPSPTP